LSNCRAHATAFARPGDVARQHDDVRRTGRVVHPGEAEMEVGEDVEFHGAGDVGGARRVRGALFGMMQQSATGRGRRAPDDDARCQPRQCRISPTLDDPRRGSKLRA
jgi:hypothetical protein